MRKHNSFHKEYSDEWPQSKDIPGYEGLYSASECGRVFSAGGKSNHVLPIELRGSFDKDGYRRVMFKKNGIKNYLRVNRIVALTYLPNLLNLPEVNHIDENKHNDNVNNLEWVSTYGNWKHTNPNKEISVLQLSRDGVTCINKFRSLMEAARSTGINQGNITNCLKGRCHSVGGFKWKTL